MSDRPKPGCCISGACHQNYVGEDSETEGDCMRLPYGVRCEHCAYVVRCTMMFGKKPTDDTCEWFPRRFRRKSLFDIKHEDPCALGEE